MPDKVSDNQCPVDKSIPRKNQADVNFQLCSVFFLWNLGYALCLLFLIGIRENVLGSDISLSLPMHRKSDSKILEISKSTSNPTRDQIKTFGFSAKSCSHVARSGKAKFMHFLIKVFLNPSQLSIS